MKRWVGNKFAFKSMYLINMYTSLISWFSVESLILILLQLKKRSFKRILLSWVFINAKTKNLVHWHHFRLLSCCLKTFKFLPLFMKIRISIIHPINWAILTPIDLQIIRNCSETIHTSSAHIPYFLLTVYHYCYFLVKIHSGAPKTYFQIRANP